MMPDAVAPTGSTDAAQVVSIGEAETLLGTSRATLYRWLATGFIAGEREGADGPWQIRIDSAFREGVTATAPEGWVGLAEAAKRLGVVRRTILDRIRRGDIAAVHVNRGQRKGLAIDVSSGSGVLFESSA